MGMTLPRITEEWLHERCREEDGCLVWTRYIFINKGRDVPKARPTKDSQPVQVRRLVWKMRTGRDPKNTDHIIRTCDTWGCVSCLAKRGPADALKGKKLPLEHRAKIAAAQRARLSDLTPEMVLQIRAAKSIEAAAAAAGVGKTTAKEIRQGLRWRDYTNPFAQLLP